MLNKIKALYCAVPPLAGDNGGGIVCREHIQRLSEVEGCDLHVCAIGDKSITSLGRPVVDDFGATFHSINFTSTDQGIDSFWLPGRRWPFTLEKLALDKAHTDGDFSRLLKQIQPDVIVVDYLLTALFVPSIFKSDARIITITMNREAIFFGQLRKLGKIDAQSSNSVIAEARLKRFEQDVYARSDAVVAFSPGDLPQHRNPDVITACIEPALNAETERWQLTESTHLFFVGNIVHYPNYLAIQWLANDFAPELRKVAPGVQLKIIGAASDDVPESWRQSNIEYLGTSTKEEVERQLRTCRLFIAPIENNFGSKIKVLECLARGTPIVASAAALSGIPFSDELPEFSLQNPAGAARLAANLVDHPNEAAKLSLEMEKLNQEFCSSRRLKWAQLLTTVNVRPVRHRRKFSRLSPLWRPRFAVADPANPWPTKLEVGVKEPIGVSTTGFYGVEMSRGRPLRWSGPKASVRIPLNHQTLPKRLAIQLHNIHYMHGLDIALFANGVEIFRGAIGKGAFSKTVPLPNVMNVRVLEIAIETTGFQAPGDVRRLGVALRSLLLCQ
jgi:glycosyltransferase involved in cell wall biosynthesis